MGLSVVELGNGKRMSVMLEDVVNNIGGGDTSNHGYDYNITVRIVCLEIFFLLLSGIVNGRDDRSCLSVYRMEKDLMVHLQGLVSPLSLEEDLTELINLVEMDHWDGIL